MYTQLSINNQSFKWQIYLKADWKVFNIKMYISIIQVTFTLRYFTGRLYTCYTNNIRYYSFHKVFAIFYLASVMEMPTFLHQITFLFKKRKYRRNKYTWENWNQNWTFYLPTLLSTNKHFVQYFNNSRLPRKQSICCGNSSSTCWKW